MQTVTVRVDKLRRTLEVDTDRENEKDCTVCEGSLASGSHGEGQFLQPAHMQCGETVARRQERRADSRLVGLFSEQQFANERAWRTAAGRRIASFSEDGRRIGLDGCCSRLFRCRDYRSGHLHKTQNKADWRKVIYLAEKEEEGEPAAVVVAWVSATARENARLALLATVRCTATLLAHTDGKPSHSTFPQL